MPRQYGFDYIVVGAGSAGCILANRLSQHYRVLLLEAGGRDWNPMIRVPLMTRLLYEMPSLNWGYDTEPQLELGGRSIHWPHGKVLGGSSSINGMAYVRGHFSDYDGWAASGLKAGLMMTCCPTCAPLTLRTLSELRNEEWVIAHSAQIADTTAIWA